MTPFKIKVCGITRPTDAGLAAELGADMLGMIFYRKSPRFVTQAEARKIVAAIPATVTRVGVFVNEEESRVLRTVERLRLDFVQLHGDETDACVRRLQGHGVKVIKAFCIKTRSDFKAVFESSADLCLLDNRSGSSRGGTGQRFDWKLKPRRRIKNLVLAGGISADNVAEGVRLFRPLAIDVNSTVESRPGVKSPRLLTSFFTRCNRIRYGR